MRMLALAGAALATALLTGAAPGTAPADGASPSKPTDAAFVKADHRGNLAEIAAGEDARTNATTACVKDVGAMLVRDHTKLDRDLTALAAKLDIALPDAPTPDQRKTLAAVRAKAGTAAYDKAWLTAQADAHRQTLAMIDHQIAAGGNAEITAAARSARPVVEMHLKHVRGGVCRPVSGQGEHHVPAGHGTSAAGPRDAAGTGTGPAATALGGGAAALAAAGGGVWLLRRRGDAR